MRDPSLIFKVAVGSSPIRGAADAPVTIIIFADYQCPFCQRVQPTLAQVRKIYGDKVRVVWKDKTLPMHTRALPAANLIGMNWTEAERYLRSKNLATKQASDPDNLLGKRGNRVVVVFEYAHPRGGGDANPSCISIHPTAVDDDWRSLVAEYTGSDQIKLVGPAAKGRTKYLVTTTTRGQLSVHEKESANGGYVAIGTCSD